MRDLLNLQQAFAGALTAPSVETAEVAIFEGEADSVRRRLSIYRGNVQGNAIKALRNAFPIVERIVGAEYFDGLVRVYAAATPSVSGDLNRYGEHFAAFIADFAPAAELPYLPDVARLEWAAQRAHYAADPPAFAFERLAALTEDRFASTSFVLHPACAIIQSRWPLARLWEVHQRDFAGEFSVDFDVAPAAVLVHRPQFRAMVRALGEGECAFLAACARGLAFGDSLAAAQEADPDFAPASHLPAWVEARVIVAHEHA